MDAELSLLFESLEQAIEQPVSPKKPATKAPLERGDKVTPSDVIPGLRVACGPDWTIEKQTKDEVFIGTVLECVATDYWAVLWDHDPDNVYTHSASLQRSELYVAKGEPIVVTKTNFLPGFHVTRGPHWTSGDEDGGIGGKGILVELIGDSWCYVYWLSTKTLQPHRIGHRGFFDLAIAAVPERNKPVPLGPYTAIPGLPVVRGPNWEFGDIHGELDSYGYLLEETKNGWIVYWLDSKKLFTVSTHNNTTCPLAYCPWGYHKPLVSAMGTPITDKFNVIVNTSNVYIGASVKGLGSDNSDTGKVISVDTVDKTCIVQFSESVTTSFEIGKSSFYKLFFTAPVNMNRYTLEPPATPDRLLPGVRVKKGPDFRSEYTQYPEELLELFGTVDSLSEDRATVSVKWDWGNYGFYRSTPLITDLSLAIHDESFLCRISTESMEINERVTSGYFLPETNIPSFCNGTISTITQEPTKSITISWENGANSTIPASQAVSKDIFVRTQAPPLCTPKTIFERLTVVLHQKEDATSNISNPSHSTIFQLGLDLIYYQKPDPLIVAEKSVILGEHFCTGTMGRIFDCYLFGKQHIAKEISKNEISLQNADDMLISEANKIRKIKHPFLLRLTALTISQSRYMIIYEYMESGSIRDVLNENADLEPKTLVQLALKMSQGLSILHANGIIHRNITSNNILVDRNFNIRISDYGFDVTRSYLADTRLAPKKDCYMAPELKTREAYTEKIDIFSMGIVFWEMDTKLVPTITAPAPFLARDVPDDVASLSAVYLRCAASNPTARPSALELVGYLAQLASNALV